MKLTIELADEQQRALEAKAEAVGLPVESYTVHLIERDLQAPPVIPTDHPIWEAILDRSAAVPAEAFANLPSDGAGQLDHYLYGHPKR